MERFFKKERDYLTALLIELVKQDTTNPPGNEYLAARVIEREFIALDIPYQKYEREVGRTNIIGTIGSGKRSLLIAAHLDVVPSGSGWDTPPFDPVIKGDRIYGRGVLDDKGLMASIMVLAKYLKTIEDQLNFQILIAGIADEERGPGYGMDWLADQGYLRPDYAIIPDNAGHMQEINIAEKGHLVLKAMSSGVQAHAMEPQKGVNAVMHLCRFLTAVEQYQFKYEPHPLLDPPTLNIGTFKGGSVYNSVPDRAEAELDIRYLPSQSSGDIIADFQRIIDQLRGEHPTLNIDLVMQQDGTPIAIDSTHPLVSTIKHEAEQFHGRPVSITGLGGGTICKDLIKHGAVAICFSTGDIELFHQVNENISLSELVDFSHLMGRVVLALNQHQLFL